jgi:release factor glutamine methyltransferase
VLATDLDPDAVACARANGVDAYVSDLDAALPSDLAGMVDVVTAVPPYVPDADLEVLPRDVQAWEPRLALLGGVDGLDTTRRVVEAAVRLLRVGGHLLVEIGGDQAGALSEIVERAGFAGVDVLRDAEGDHRGIEATRSGGG